ncbi:hypothetical protein CC78DRAFT_583579 [Lojkania enalia]|uniref:Uncharacterized protein n=1 Tax=Lojkania enalia TaxID=147567 RepID=A0A9P4K8S8_9PLEO|nr:hypothetical protein CC78DRAFT_583579 [Didymosphaeria enalia]
MADTRHCHKPRCDWISLDNIRGLQDVPPLLPNPEVSGIGVILGFSLAAYLTLGLLILHYVTVHDPHRINSRGNEYTNTLDRDLLAFLRSVIVWTPSRRFEYAMEKSVLILSDLQLVTGLAILVSGYSQLNCAISAYHWQIVVYVAWFSSFTFLSAMAFLEGYFQTNSNMRIIRLCSMVILASLLIVALLPTGSQNWLDLVDEGGGFYPGLPTVCYFEQLVLNTYTHGGPKVWSMAVSVLVVGLSYIRSGIRLLDPTAEFSRQYFRARPGLYVKRLLYFLERRAGSKGARAFIWQIPYLVSFAAFVSTRVAFDIVESMLLEVIWLSFAIAWGTIKLYDTRASAGYNTDGEDMGANPEVLEENTWSFGQTLPLVLLLLPIMSMVQAYLDNDAKAQAITHKAAPSSKEATFSATSAPAELSSIKVGDNNDDSSNPRNSMPCSVFPCNRHQSLQFPCTCLACDGTFVDIDSPPPLPPRSPYRSAPFYHPGFSTPELPKYPYAHFIAYPWYKDQIFLLVLQILIVAALALYLLNAVSNFLGLSFFLRNRLFLIWILGMLPLGMFLHLVFWYVACWIVHWAGIEEWLLKNRTESSGEWLPRWRRITLGKTVYWCLRMLLIAGILLFTFFTSVELAGPLSLDI